MCLTMSQVNGTKRWSLRPTSTPSTLTVTHKGTPMPKQSLGKVIKLYTTLKGDAHRHQHQSLSLDAEGVIGDKFHAKALERSVLIASTDSYRLVEENNIAIEEGSLGENILIDWNPYHLLPGETFRIGELILQITQNCTICKGLSNVDPKLPKLLKNDRGIFAKVLHSASINIGDRVQLSEN